MTASAGGPNNAVDLQQCVNALYIVRVDDVKTAKFIPMQ